jgi:hypothetical protein
MFIFYGFFAVWHSAKETLLPHKILGNPTLHGTSVWYYLPSAQPDDTSSAKLIPKDHAGWTKSVTKS